MASIHSYPDQARPALSMLVAADSFLIVLTGFLGFLTYLTVLPEIPAFWNIGHDWSAGEVFNYLKWAAIIGLFTQAWRTGIGGRLELAAALFFLIVLLDDALMLHERLSADALLGLLPGLDGIRLSTVLNERLIWFLLGLVGLAILSVGWRASTPEARLRMLPVALLFGGVVFFAVVVDQVTHMTAPRSVASGLMSLLEDGGEMIMISFLLIRVQRDFGGLPVES